MRNKLLTKPWLAAHVLVVLCAVAFVFLGWWQLQRGQSATGGMQNFGYALQWPAFAIALLTVWVKSMRDELHPGRTRNRKLRRHETMPSARVSLASKSRPAGFDEEDAEVAAYNRYLAQLNARHGRYAR